MKFKTNVIVQFILVLLIGFVIGLVVLQKVQVEKFVDQNNEILQELNRISSREIEIQKLESKILANKDFVTAINCLEDSIFFIVIPDSYCHDCMTTVYEEISRQASSSNIEIKVLSSFEKLRANKSVFQEYKIGVLPIPKIPEGVTKCFLFRMLNNNLSNCFIVEKNQAKSVVRYFSCF